MKYFKKIIGERVYLSPMCIDDAPKYVEWLSDFEVTKGLGNTKLIPSVESERSWIAANLEKGLYCFAIIDKETDELIGNCGFNDIDTARRIGTIGIFIGDEEKRSKGLGTDTLKALIGFGFDILNLNNICLQVFNFNERAIKCYKKVGFKEFGRRHQVYPLNGNLYDEVYMEILRKDFFGEK